MIILKPRHMKLIELFLSTDQFQSSQSLANYFGVSSKTIRKMLEELSEALSRHGATLEAKPGIGYRLVLTDSDAFHEYLVGSNALDGNCALYSESVPQIHRVVRYLLMHESFMKIEDLSAYLFINRTDAKKLFSEAKKVLRMFDLGISLEGRKGFSLIGSEMDRRYCMVYEYPYYQKESGYTGVDQAYAGMMQTDRHTFQAIRNCIIELQNSHGAYNLSEYTLDYLTRLILLCRFRDQCDRPVVFKDETVLRLSSRNSYYVARQIMNRCEDLLDHSFSREDVLMISVAIIGLRALLDPPKQIVNGAGYLTNKDLALDMIQAIAHLDQFQQMQNDLELIERMAIEMEGLQTRAVFHCYSNQITAVGFPHCSWMSMRLALQCSMYLKSEKNMQITMEDVVRMAMLIHPLFGRYHFEFRPLKCCVVSKYDKVIASSMAERLMRNYRRFIGSMQIREKYELNEEILSGYDVLFADQPKDAFPVGDSTYFIETDLFFDERTKAKIQQELIQVSKNSPDSTMFDPDHIHTNIVVEDVDGLLHYVADTVAQDSNRNEDSDAIFSDFKNVTEIMPLHADNSVVYLHSIRNYNAHATLYVFLLKKPIGVHSGGSRIRIAVYLDRGTNKEESALFENENLPHRVQRIFEDPSMINLLLLSISKETIEKRAWEISRDVISGGASFR